MTHSPDNLPKSPAPDREPADVVPAWGRAPSPVQAERSSADSSGHTDSTDVNHAPVAQPPDLVPAAPSDPAWNGWDILRLTLLTIVALFAGVFVVLLISRWWLYPHSDLGEIAHIPLVLVAGQSVAYLLILAYMYVLVTRERHRPDFFAAIHWNWPSNIVVYVLAGFVLSVSLQGLAHFLPIPKELPIDTYFRTPAEAWALGILSVTLAPLMEELFFRGFLYPVLARSLGLPVAVFLTALGFALLHGAQLMFSWGPVLVIFLVGIVLTMVRAKTNSVAAGVLIHMAYNGTITIAMYAATDGFRHLERLNQ
ncbi:MAG: type II CAAX endopeptidase family protein [Terriglobales bacterium]